MRRVLRRFPSRGVSPRRVFFSVASSGLGGGGSYLQGEQGQDALLGFRSRLWWHGPSLPERDSLARVVAPPVSVVASQLQQLRQRTKELE